MFWYVAPPENPRAARQRRPGWRDEDRENLKQCGVSVHPCLREGPHGTLEPPTEPPLISSGPAWAEPHTLYLVYNAVLRVGHGVRGGPWQSGKLRVIPGTPTQLSFEHVMCQNHSCITQLILRLGDATGVKEHFEVASRVFGTDNRGGKTWSFKAPETCGFYNIDFVTDWQYSMRDAVGRKVEGDVAVGAERRLVMLEVGEELPWSVERLVCLLCQCEDIPSDVARKVCGFLGHWREGQMDQTPAPETGRQERREGSKKRRERGAQEGSSSGPGVEGDHEETQGSGGDDTHDETTDVPSNDSP